MITAASWFTPDKTSAMYTKQGWKAVKNRTRNRRVFILLSQFLLQVLHHPALFLDFVAYFVKSMHFGKCALTRSPAQGRSSEPLRPVVGHCLVQKALIQGHFCDACAAYLSLTLPLCRWGSLNTQQASEGRKAKTARYAVVIHLRVQTPGSRPFPPLLALANNTSRT